MPAEELDGSDLAYIWGCYCTFEGLGGEIAKDIGRLVDHQPVVAVLNTLEPHEPEQQPGQRGPGSVAELTGPVLLEHVGCSTPQLVVAAVCQELVIYWKSWT